MDAELTMIYADERVLVAFHDVQHIEKLTKPIYKNERGFSEPTGDTEPNGLWIITKHTQYNYQQDCWENPVYIREDEASGFIESWTKYVSEIEKRKQSNQE